MIITLKCICVHRPFSSSRNVANIDSLTSFAFCGGGNSSKFSTNRPGSMSETNLLKYRPHKEGHSSTARPESALGLLQGIYQ